MEDNKETIEELLATIEKMEEEIKYMKLYIQTLEETNPFIQDLINKNN